MRGDNQPILYLMFNIVWDHTCDCRRVLLCREHYVQDTRFFYLLIQMVSEVLR